MNGPFQKLLPQEGVSRRDVVVGAALVGGALVVGCSPADLMSAGSKVEPGAFGPFIQIDPDGAVTVLNKHIEFGQGNHAGLAAIVAEELDADWAKVRVVHAPGNAKLYGNGGMGIQLTGGSSAIANSWEQLRKAGAGARAMFVQAAATRWNVPAGQITVKDGVVSGGGKSAGFGELIADAAKVAPPESPVLKDPKTFTLIGTDRVRRKDSLIKSNGTARYTQDVQLPNMLVAMVAHAPRFGASVKSFNADDAKTVAGVIDVYQIPTGVAVVADTTYAARMGREALKVEWDEGKVETRSSETIAGQWRDIAAGKGPGQDIKWERFDSRGTEAEAMGAKGAPVLETTYDFPYLAHATMEPMNCVAIVDGLNVKLIHGSQAPTLDQMAAGKIVKTLPGSVEVEVLYAGGSFGRRANFQSDYVAECVHVAQKVGGGRPVKLIWTREDDMQAGFFRPLVHHAVRVTLDKDGYPATWRHRIVTQSIMKDSPMPAKGPDQTAIEGTSGSPYLKATPVVDAQLALPEAGVPVLWWRSVGATHTAFVMEHTIDQLALKAGKDPVDYRRALYAKAGSHGARHLAALNLAVEKAGPAPAAGFTRGVAVHESFGSVVAQVAEVKLVDGLPRVGRVVTAIDCGLAVATDQIAAQVEGGTCYGLSAALYGEITLTDGKVDQSNFDTYRVLRMNEAPTVETHIVPSANPPSGVGEPGTPVIAPAVANALLALSKTPTTRLPFARAQA
jgi:isoquinoline 1-oxidoreductase beta subunit